MIKETLYKISGFRKTGLLPDVKETFAVQQYIPTKQEVEASKKKIALPKSTVNFNVYSQDQGTYSDCWAYALTGAMNASLTQKLRMQTCMEGYDFAKDVEKLEPGVMKNGNTLQDTIAKAKQLGVYDKVTKKLYVPSVQIVAKKDLQTALNNDKIIFTGFLVNVPGTIDAEYCWKPGKYGHAIYLNGPSDVGAWWMNSWKNFGIDDTGLAKIRAMDYGKLFTCYAVEAIPMAQSFKR